MKRIDWLDTCRGIAILFLVLVHYVGALESRNFISKDLLLFSQAFLRVATPYFILIFGFTFFVAFKNKPLRVIYPKLFKKLALVFLAREAIVIISMIRYPELKDQLFATLTYQQVSISGEILTFYFLAILAAPIALRFVQNKGMKYALVSILLLYFFGYSVGVYFDAMSKQILFRILFFEYQLLFGTAAVIGHIFPVYINFKGGKGIATILGVLLSLNLTAALYSCVVFLVILFLSKYVSLSSILACFFYSVFIFFIYESNIKTEKIFSIFVPFISLITHRKNILRLINKEETKVKFGAK